MVEREGLELDPGTATNLSLCTGKHLACPFPMRKETLKYVLAENTVMLAMCRSLGFEVKLDPVEHDICNVRLAL